MVKHLLIVWSWLIVFSACTQKKTNTDMERSAEFPILAWIGVPEAETTVERFKELKESGININFSWYSSIEAVEKALDIAQEAGVKLLPSCPELKIEPEETAKRLMKHPALAGYHLRDEPCATDFPELAEWVKRIQSVDMEHGCYINLFPNYANQEQLLGKDARVDPGKDVYEQHVELFLRNVPVSFISFDHYPVVESEGVRTLRSGWYKNLEIIAKASQKSGLPFWAFALAVAHKPYPVPTLEELRLQMFSNLAYGAQTLQYFTYWQPDENPIWDFHDAPIDLNGKRTIVYDRIKTVNQEIQNLSTVFYGAKLVSVWHTGKQIPEGTRPIDKLPDSIKALETSDGGAVVSILEKGGERFLVIVNRDFQKPMELRITTDKKVRKVLKDGISAPVRNFSGTMDVDPGDVAIFTWKN